MNSSIYDILTDEIETTQINNTLINSVDTQNDSDIERTNELKQQVQEIVSENQRCLTDGKYVQNKYDYDCVFVQEPFHGVDGFIMSMKQEQSIIQKYERRHGDKWLYKDSLRQKAYQELYKHKYFDISFEQWKQMSKPKPFRVKL